MKARWIDKSSHGIVHWLAADEDDRVIGHAMENWVTATGTVAGEHAEFLSIEAAKKWVEFRMSGLYQFFDPQLNAWVYKV
jgi:hypothetical protein